MDLLPDDALLIIFDFYVDDDRDVDVWHTLLHVCQKWRYVVLSSPRRLNLRLLCTDIRPVREMLDIWPAIPIVIWKSRDPISLEEGADNIIAALEHPDRVCEIRLGNIPSSILESFAAVMQEPFLALTSLELLLDDKWDPPVLPESFLGGSVPRLLFLDLNCIPFSAVRNLLLSASDLVYLCLWDMPDSGYISPEEIATYLSTMTRLETLELGFYPYPYDSPPKRAPIHASQDSDPSPIIRTSLPALTHFWFQGDNEYLENLMAYLETPLLDDVTIINSFSPLDSLDSVELR